jgi:hypothetical protein
MADLQVLQRELDALRDQRSEVGSGWSPIHRCTIWSPRWRAGVAGVLLGGGDAAVGARDPAGDLLPCRRFARSSTPTGRGPVVPWGCGPRSGTAVGRGGPAMGRCQDGWACRATTATGRRCNTTAPEARRRAHRCSAEAGWPAPWATPGGTETATGTPGSTAATWTGWTGTAATGSAIGAGMARCAETCAHASPHVAPLPCPPRPRPGHHAQATIARRAPPLAPPQEAAPPRRRVASAVVVLGDRAAAAAADDDVDHGRSAGGGGGALEAGGRKRPASSAAEGGGEEGQAGGAGGPRKRGRGLFGALLMGTLQKFKWVGWGTDGWGMWVSVGVGGGDLGKM